MSSQDQPPQAQSEQAWLAAYDPRAFPPVAVTVDVVALTLRQDRLHVLLVQRAGPPFQGRWALPGGFVRAGEEGLDQAAARELAEETGVDTAALRRVHLEQLGSYGAPARDPRMHIVSVAYLAFAPDLPDPQAGTDAAAAAWVPLDGTDPTAGPHRGGPSGRTGPAGHPLAFDHAAILADALDRARSKLEYTPLATAFLGSEFTISELRSVYEEIWGEKLHAGNFHRKVLSVPGFVESTGGTATRAGSRGGPRARLYRAGDARLLHPALLRPDREEAVR
ncbi:NUDIX hydrolase [Streptacidiphilus carbonis]|uniref:NUDIX hydrolase n=1 Tax=Streptacidiphilus carbonis TaxID=105422 RepID=UPI0005A6CFD1|nr:NUDIX domain-containing protein [Streptacidiphilus carbonis]